MKNNKETYSAAEINEEHAEATKENIALDAEKKRKQKESRDRMDFQVHLMEEMIGKNKSNEENLEWVNNYATQIGNIIDNKVFCKNCSKIRLSIENRDFKEAARLIKPEIKVVEAVV